MRVDIVPIGSSKGIRLPKSVLEHCGFQKTVDIEVIDHHLVVKALPQARQGWKEDFAKEAASAGDELDDTLEDIKLVPCTFEQEEWQW